MPAALQHQLFYCLIKSFIKLRSSTKCFSGYEHLSDSRMHAGLHLMKRGWAVQVLQYQLQVMESPLEKKAGVNYGPPGQKKLIYFVDDLNM
jgi:hypothetical protein